MYDVELTLKGIQASSRNGALLEHVQLTRQDLARVGKCVLMIYTRILRI
jgi:hypothetical protein